MVLLDIITHNACKCGCKTWVVDGGDGEYWLLCMDSFHKGCVHTKPIPKGMEVEEGE